MGCSADPWFTLTTREAVCFCLCKVTSLARRSQPAAAGVSSMRRKDAGRGAACNQGRMSVSDASMCAWMEWRIGQAQRR